MSLLARLIEAGTPAELIEEVAMMLAEKKAAEQAIEQRRAKARERQARKRARDADSPDVTESNAMSRDKRDTPLSLSPLSSPHTPQHTPHTHTPVYNTPRARDPFPCPEWCEPEVWRDLKANRSKKRLANTPTAHKKFISQVLELAEDGWPPGEVVRDIAAKGWGGAYDPREQQVRNRNATTNDKRDGAMRALDRQLGLDDFAGTSGRPDASEGSGYRQLAHPTARDG